jgi:hypothetical protein
MDKEEMSRQEEVEYKALLETLADRAVVGACLDVKPLLLERRSIGRYVRRNPQLRAALTEVNSVNEAILLAIGDWFLTLQQTEQLRELLQAELRSPTV